MNEDRTLMETVQRALERETSTSPETMRVLREEALRVARSRQRRRQILNWGLPTLLAASMVLFVALAVTFRSVPTKNGSELSAAIELLCALDGVDTDAFVAKTDAERLLAWQDVWCEF